MIPVLAALAKWGLPLIASAVATKGKELVEEKLGVNLDDALGTEEGRLKLMQLQAAKEEMLQQMALEHRRLDVAEFRLEQENTASARDMNTRLQEAERASRLAKNAAYILDFVIIGSTLLLGAVIVLKAIPVENENLVFTVFGSLMALCGTVVNFHRGTSASSKGKDDTIKHALEKLP